MFVVEGVAGTPSARCFFLSLVLRGALSLTPRIPNPSPTHDLKNKTNSKQASSSARGGTRRWTGGCSSQETATSARAARRVALASAACCLRRRRRIRLATARPRPCTAAGPRTTRTLPRGSTTSTRSGSTQGKGTGGFFWGGEGEREKRGRRYNGLAEVKKEGFFPPSSFEERKFARLWTSRRRKTFCSPFIRSFAPPTNQTKLTATSSSRTSKQETCSCL